MKQLIILLLLSQSAFAADMALLRSATVRLQQDSTFCSGVCVSPDGDIITAEHCFQDGEVQVTFDDGRTGTAVMAYNPVRNNKDEAARFRMKSGTWPFAPIAKSLPKVGDKVSSVGFPQTTFAYLEGKVTKVTDDWIRTDMTMISGHSGGPLFNESGELIGICSGHESNREFGLWISLSSISKAMTGNVTRAAEKGTVVVFSYANLRRCAPCANLMSEIQNGFMKEYELKICKVDDSGNWDSSEATRLYGEFRNLPGTNDGLPVVWVYGTDQYKSGFDPKKKLSLLTFLGGVIDSIGEVLVGEPIFPAPPRTKPAPRGALKPIADGEVSVVPEEEFVSTPDYASEIQSLRDELLALKNGTIAEKLKAISEIQDSVAVLRQGVSQVESRQTTVGELVSHLGPIKDDLDAIKNGSIIEKAKAVADLKSEMSEVRGLALQAKTDLDVNPYGFLPGIPGILLGLGLRYYKSRRHDVSA